jgi:4-amino-4-deoxy-L-arabinose transferase-like glycosyltransferase
MGKTRKIKKPAARQTTSAPIDDRRIEYMTVGLILLAASILILSNLGNIYLWQDEAQTACVAKTILTHGVPLGFDGTNSFSQQGGAEYGANHIWRWHTWFPFYVLAGFFALFGTSDFVCRLPFALAGIGTVILAYYYGRLLWRRRSAGVLAAALLLVNVPFLLLVRQCRYYSMTALFALGALYAYSQMLRGRRGAHIAFIASFLLLFHTFYVYCPPLLAAIVVHSAIYHRDKLRRVLLISAISVALVLPWMVYFSSVYSAVHGGKSIIQSSLVLIGQFFGQTAKLIFTPLLPLTLLAVAWAWIRTGRRPVLDSEKKQNVVLLALFAVAVILVLGPSSPFAFFRYLAPIIPVCILITALIMDSSWKVGKVIPLAVLVGMAFFLKMPDYLYEIRHDYDGGGEGIVKYLNTHAHKGDTVIVNHEGMPIKWYTGLKVYSPLSGEDYRPGGTADWVILRWHVGSMDRPITSFMDDTIPLEDVYKSTKLPYPDTPDENREELSLHQFRTDTRERDVVIWHRVRD